jgi:hypothetical protein
MAPAAAELQRALQASTGAALGIDASAARAASHISERDVPTSAAIGQKADSGKAQQHLGPRRGFRNCSCDTAKLSFAQEDPAA